MHGYLQERSNILIPNISFPGFSSLPDKFTGYNNYVPLLIPAQHPCFTPRVPLGTYASLFISIAIYLNYLYSNFKNNVNHYMSAKTEKRP